MHCLASRNIAPPAGVQSPILSRSAFATTRASLEYFAQLLLQDRAILFAEVQFANLSPSDTKRGTQFIMGPHQIRLRHLLHFIP